MPARSRTFSVRNCILLSDVNESAETAQACQVEVIELFGMCAVDGPGLTGIQEGGKYHYTVYRQIGGKAESSVLPDILM